MTRILVAAFFALAAFATQGAALAQDRTCQSEIARLQALIAQAEAGGQPVPDMAEGTFATMHHQPTAASVLAADKDAMAKAKTALAQARKYQAKGKNAACLKALDDVAF
jgi:hypothetical protein